MSVYALPGTRVPSSAPKQELVGVLEKLLEHAKSGRLQSFVGTGFMANGTRLTAWVDLHDNIYEMLGSIAWLHSEYVHKHTIEVPPE